MEKRRFEEWLQEEPSGNFFLCECRIPRVYFQEVCIPEIRRKLGVSEVSWVRQEDEWSKEQQELLFPSLFRRKRAIFLEGLAKEKVFQIAREASRYPGTFFFFLSPPEVLQEPFWQKFPWIVVEESREVFLRFLREEETRLGLFLENEARETLFRFVSEYELQRGDVVDFLEKFRGGQITKEEVETFFTQSERILLFRFLDALGERDTSSALRYAYRLVEYQFPLSLLVVHLARRFRLFAQFCEGRGMKKDLWQGKEINPFEARKIEKMQEHFRLSDIPRIFAILRTADRLLKTQSIDPYLWCALLVSGITQPERVPD